MTRIQPRHVHFSSIFAPFGCVRFAFIAGFVAFLAGFVQSSGVHGAEITLLDDRVWEGVVVREEKDFIVLETVGGEIEISRRAIKRIDRRPTRREMYRTRLAAIDKAAADQHYILGLWCRRQRLGREAAYHLNYAVGLEPDHAGARRALGHIKYNDKWMPEKEAKEAQGLRFYNGRWMTREAAEIAEARELRRELVRELERRVSALAEIVANPRSEKARRRARSQLLGIRDPLAHDALIKLMRHRNTEVRQLALRIADRLELPRADREVILRALYDTEESVRERALKSIEKRWNDGMLGETLKALRHKDNHAVRSAAGRVLAVAKDPTTIDALIGALYVKYHVKRTGEPGAPVLGLTARHAIRRPPVGLRGVVYDPRADAAGTPAWRPVDAPDDSRHAYLINYAALDALRAITHKDFGVNKRAWREWWDENRDDFNVWKEIK